MKAETHESEREQIDLSVPFTLMSFCFHSLISSAMEVHHHSAFLKILKIKIYGLAKRSVQINNELLKGGAVLPTREPRNTAHLMHKASFIINFIINK